MYAVIFALCKLDVKDYAKSYQDIEELLCAVSGFRMTDLPMDIQGQMIKWMLSLEIHCHGPLWFVPEILPDSYE